MKLNKFGPSGWREVSKQVDSLNRKIPQWQKVGVVGLVGGWTKGTGGSTVHPVLEMGARVGAPQPIT